MEEYLTIAEVAALLKLSAKSVQNKMAQGLFVEGIHYFRRAGIRPRFKAAAVKRWLEEEGKPGVGSGIRMLRGYVLGNSLTGARAGTIDHGENGLQS